MAYKCPFYAGFECGKKQPEFSDFFARMATIGQPLTQNAVLDYVQHERKMATISLLF